MLTAAEKRRHAQLLAARDNSVMAQALAGLLRAEANLEDALAGVEPQTAEHCYIDREYPLLGRCCYDGGRLIETQHPWQGEQVAACKELGLDVAFQWASDPACGLDQQELIRIWIGTRETGPRLQWDRTSGKWLRLVSRGDFGKNWACGGHWREDKPIAQRQSIYYDTIEAACPEIAAILATIA